jgi:hypothetical protein
MNRAFIARWIRIPRSIGRLSASASSHPSLSSAAFIINMQNLIFGTHGTRNSSSRGAGVADRCLE